MESTLHKKQKRLIGVILFFLTIAFFIGYMLVKKHTSFPEKTSLDADVVQSIHVTNVTDRSAAVVMCLKESMIAQIVLIGENNKEIATFLDDRDISTLKQARICNYFQLKNLHKGSYTIMPVIEGIRLSQKNKELVINENYRFINASPMWGKVVDAKSEPIKSGVVIVTFEGSGPISGIVKNGDWLVPIHYLSNLPEKSKKVIVRFFDDNGESSTVTTTYGKIDELKKTIIIGKNYDYTDSMKLETSSVMSNRDFDIVDIIYPKDKSVIPGGKPLFKGVAIPKRTVKLRVESLTRSRTFNVGIPLVGLTANDKGIWNFSPKTDLVPGDYRVTVTSQDENKRNRIVAQTFTILKSGETVLGLATPEGTLNPTATISPTSQPSPTVSVQATTTPVTLTVAPTVSSPAATLTPGPTLILTTPTPPSTTPLEKSMVTSSPTLAVQQTITLPASGAFNATTLGFLSVGLITIGGLLLIIF